MNPDEERNFRAVISTEELQEATAINKALLAAIASQLRTVAMVPGPGTRQRKPFINLPPC